MSRRANTIQQESRLPPDYLLVFGPFELDPGRATLTRGGTELPLRPKCFDVLRYLVERQGRLVAKEELIAAMWPGLVVTDRSLSQCIVEIRGVLGTEGAPFIRTVPRRGYCFESQVNWRPANPSVISARFSDNKCRIWLVALLATTLVIVLHAEIKNFTATVTGSTQANSLARQEYVLGNYFYDRRSPGDAKRSIGYFRHATELDPGNADAWVGLASSIYMESVMAENTDFHTVMPEFKAALDRALELEPGHAEAHARIIRYYAASGQRSLVEDHLKLAMQNGQSNAVVLAIAAGEAYKQQDLQSAIELQSRSVDFKPNSYAGQSNLGSYYFLAGNPALARHHLMIARDLSPNGMSDTNAKLIQAMVLMGDYSTMATLAKHLEEGPDRDQAMAFVYDARGDEARRDVYLDALASNSSASSALRLAEFKGYKGNQIESRNWLRRSLQLKSRENSKPVYSNFLKGLQFSPFLADSVDDALLAEAVEWSGVEVSPF